MILVPGMVKDHHDDPENLVSTKKIFRNGNSQKWQLLPGNLTSLPTTQDISDKVHKAVHYRGRGLLSCDQFISKFP